MSFFSFANIGILIFCIVNEIGILFYFSRTENHFFIIHYHFYHYLQDYMYILNGRQFNLAKMLSSKIDFDLNI